MKAALGLALWLLLLAAPTVPAHVSAFSDAKVVTAGAFGVLLDPQPAPLYANATIQMRALVSDAQSGNVDGRAQLTADFRAPSGRRTQLNLSQSNADFGYRTAAIVFEAPGNYSVHVVVQNGSDQPAADTWFIVYPDLPFRINVVAPLSDPVQGEKFNITAFLGKANGTGAWDDATDVSMRMQQWTDDHKHLLGVEDLALVHTRSGTWEVNHTFSTPGMFHMLFSSQSAHFTNDMVPVFHVYVTPLATSSAPSPGPGWFLVLLAGAFVLRRRS